MAHPLKLTTYRARADFGTTVFYASFAILSVIARVYCKMTTIKQLGPDDYTIFAALLFCLGMCATNMTEILLGGMGRHVMDIPPENLVVLLKGIIVFQVMWGISLMFVKISFLLFFSKIFSVGRAHLIFKLAMVIVLLWGLGAVLSSFLVCQPLAFNWDFTIPGGKCGNRPLSYMLIGVFHILTDVMVLTIPIPFLWRLQIARPRKISLSAIFSLGFVCCAISLVRVIELNQVTYDDITYSLVPGSYWTLLEPSLAIFIASLPAMAPVLDRIINRRRQKNQPFRPKRASEGKAFQQLDDAGYPLEDTLFSTQKDKGNTVSDIETGTGNLTIMGKDDYDDNMYNPSRSYVAPPPRAISKTTTIVAQSSYDSPPEDASHLLREPTLSIGHESPPDRVM